MQCSRTCRMTMTSNALPLRISKLPSAEAEISSNFPRRVCDRVGIGLDAGHLQPRVGKVGRQLTGATPEVADCPSALRDHTQHPRRVHWSPAICPPCQVLPNAVQRAHAVTLFELSLSMRVVPFQSVELANLFLRGHRTDMPVLAVVAAINLPEGVWLAAHSIRRDEVPALHGLLVQGTHRIGHRHTPRFACVPTRKALLPQSREP